MEVGIPQSALSSLEKSFNSTSRLSIDGISNVLEVKLGSQNKQLVDMDKDDEGEIMLLAMILHQLHGGVKMPLESPPSPSADAEDDDPLNKKKRQRTSPDQLAILEEIFQTDKMPNQQTRVQLADKLGMSSRRVQIWFQNKRAKVKRSVSKDGECPSPDELRSSSSSVPPPSSPSSDESSIGSPSPIVITTPSQQNITPLPTASPSTPSSTAAFPFTAPSPSTPTSSVSTATSSPSSSPSSSILKQPFQFSRSNLFVEKQTLLAASY